MKMMSEIIQLIMEKVYTTDGYKKNWIGLHWHEVVGAAAEKHSAPRKLDKGVLVVKVDSSAWTYSLFIRKNEFLTRINDLYGEAILTDIKYQAGEMDGQRVEKEQVGLETAEGKNFDRYGPKFEQKVIDSMRKKVHNKNESF